MVNSISPIAADMRLTQLLEDGVVAADRALPVSTSEFITPGQRIELSGNPFEDVLSKAIESLNNVSQSEIYADRLVNNYLKGEVELQDVMIAQAKANLMVQFAVTTVNSAVNTFKEVTQMQI